MSKPAFTRSDILTPGERRAAARKCLKIIGDPDKLNGKAQKFVVEIYDKFDIWGDSTFITERQLAFLRDITEEV